MPYAKAGEAADEIERLRKGIQDFLDGNYPHPRSYRAQGPQTTCPHGRYYYEDCNSCDSEHFQKLLNLEAAKAEKDAE
jgi:hypothetical protein